MSFNTALSGIRAASKDLAVTGNNIANASTTGFKSSRAEFGDLYASSVLGSGSNPTGSGVRLQDVAQNFQEGNITFTENTLDLAISGSGFFMVNIEGEQLYTRAGTFGRDDEGFIVNNAGGRLQGFPANESGQVGGLRGDLRIDTSNQAPSMSTEVSAVYNLNAASEKFPADPTSTSFDPLVPGSYTSASSMNIYDSQGNPHVMTQFFTRVDTAATNEWEVRVRIGENMVGGATPTVFPVTFDPSGQLATGGDITVSGWAPANTTDQDLTISLAGTTQFNDDFGEYNITQNGYTSGRLSSLNIDDSGLIFARFTNGQSQTLGQITLANFSNEQGLEPRGDTMWSQSADSGVGSVGIPGTSDIGAIQSGALEESNVDLSQQLVNLIVAQRNFQASAKTIETADQTTQTIINLR